MIPFTHHMISPHLVRRAKLSGEPTRPFPSRRRTDPGARAAYPPPIMVENTPRRLDGGHRRRAYGKYQEKYQTLLQQARDDDSLVEPPDEISCEFHEIPEGIEPKLYALYLSSRRSQPTPRRKEEAAQEQYKAHPGASFKLIAKYTGVAVLGKELS